jgi:hypothetical protein
VAVAIEMNFKGATLDQYDRIREKTGLTPNGATPPGAIAHWVAATDEGLHIVDVWESQEAFDKYAEDVINPYSAEVGMTDPTEMRVYEVHNYLTKA